MNPTIYVMQINANEIETTFLSMCKENLIYLYMHSIYIYIILYIYIYIYKKMDFDLQGGINKQCIGK